MYQREISQKAVIHGPVRVEYASPNSSGKLVGNTQPGEQPYMYWQPVVRCKNSECPAPSAARIRLPYPDAPATSALQPNWPPEGWQARIICRDCDHWFIYQKADVQWATYTVPLGEQGNLNFWSVELECAEPGCKSRTKWNVLDNSGMSETEISEFVGRADPVAVCENDHPFAISGIASQSAQKVSSI
jgi:hypothetical protein